MAIVIVLTPIWAILAAEGVGFVVESIWRIWHVRVIVAVCGTTVIALLCARVACVAIVRIKVPVLSIKPV
jgi:hypothetical protein